MKKLFIFVAFIAACQVMPDHGPQAGPRSSTSALLTDPGTYFYSYGTGKRDLWSSTLTIYNPASSGVVAVVTMCRYSARPLVENQNDYLAAGTWFGAHAEPQGGLQATPNKADSQEDDSAVELFVSDPTGTVLDDTDTTAFRHFELVSASYDPAPPSFIVHDLGSSVEHIIIREGELWEVWSVANTDDWQEAVAVVWEEQLL
jgi:hypothetical protein